MRKQILKWALVFLVAIFAGLPLSLHSTPLKTEITFWHAMEGRKQEVLQQMVNEFNRTHPAIFVKAEFKGSAMPYANNYSVLIGDLLSALRQGEPPTLSQVYENWTAQFIGAGALVPIQKFVGKGYASKELHDFVPSFLKSNEPGGKLWTLPFNKSLYVLYYNKNMLEKAGLGPPETWDNFRKEASALTVKDKNGNISRYGFTEPPRVDLFNLIFYAFGGDYFLDGKADFNGIVGRSAMHFIREMAEEKTFLPDYEARKDFISERAAMYIDTTGEFAYLSKSAPFPVGVAAIPKGVRAVSLFAGTNLAIFKHATLSQQNAAWVFIKWILEPARVAQWSMETGYLPVRKSAMKLPAFQHYLQKDPRLSLPISQLDRAFTDPRVWAWESIRGFVEESVEGVVSGKMKIQEALDEAARRTNLLLENDPTK